MADERIKKVMRLGDIIPMTDAGMIFKSQKETIDKIEKYREQKAKRDLLGKNFIDAWNHPDTTVAEKYAAIKRQVAPIKKTMDIVVLPGQISIDDDPEAFTYMVAAFCTKHEIAANIAGEIADDFLSDYPEFTMQQIGMYFKFLDRGRIETNGRLNYKNIFSSFYNYKKWVVYHHDIFVLSAEHMIHKEGSRDFHEWYNNGRPEGEEF